MKLVFSHLAYYKNIMWCCTVLIVLDSQNPSMFFLCFQRNSNLVICWKRHDFSGWILNKIWYYVQCKVKQNSFYGRHVGKIIVTKSKNCLTREVWHYHWYSERTASLFCDRFQEEIFLVLIPKQNANNATLHAFEYETPQEKLMSFPKT